MIKECCGKVCEIRTIDGEHFSLVCKVCFNTYEPSSQEEAKKIYLSHFNKVKEWFKKRKEGLVTWADYPMLTKEVELHANL